MRRRGVCWTWVKVDVENGIFLGKSLKMRKKIQLMV
jgi:hypothetical protein